MRIIDADAHVLETMATFDYMDPSERQYRPEIIADPEPGPSGDIKKWWLIDGRRREAPYPGGGTAALLGPYTDDIALDDDAKFLLDVQARVRHMDELGTDIQVLYPTLFLGPMTDNPDIDVALRKSYNRWMADVWAESKGRLRWAAVLPLLNMDRAREELRFARDNGACAVMVRGVEASDRLLDDPYFYPLYEEASDLDLPICVHAGCGSHEMSRIWGGFDRTFARAKLPGVSAFHLILYTGIPDRFPKLKFGFVELSAQWLPYLMHDLQRRVERRNMPWKERPLADNRIWVACQTNDDHETIIRYVGDDNLTIGTDYGHADTSTEVMALQTFKNEAGLPQETIRKILDDNPAALYGL